MAYSLEKDRFQHRFYNEIEKLIQRGTNQFILHGKNLYDDWFFTHVQGSANATDSLAYNLLHRQKMQKVVSLDKDGLSIYKKDDFKARRLEGSEIKKELLEVVQKNKSIGKKNPKENNKVDQESVDFATQDVSQSALLNTLRDITQALRTQKEPMGVIVNSLEWIAELFEGKNHQINYLEEIEKWKTINMSGCIHLTFILLNSIKEIKKYFFIEEDSSEVLRVGKPTVDEIMQSYKVINRSEIASVSEDSMKKTASLIKNNGYLLKNAIYLYGTILKQVGKEEFYKDKKFYTHFVHQLKANIEEDVSWDDVILNKSIKDNIIKKFENFLSSSGETKEGSKGFLFYGPPGTGKTHIAKALANKGGFYFMAPKLADIKGEYIGHSSKNVQKIFEEARANSPTLIFLDELDTLFPQRGSGSQDSFQNDITNQFLAEVDGVDTGKQDIFLIGATNRIDIIDSAMISRLEEINIALPNHRNRIDIFKHNLKKIADSLNENDYESLADKSDGLSGRDIKNVSYDISKLFKKNKNFNECSKESLQKFKDSIVKQMQSGYFDISTYEERKKDQGFTQIIGYEYQKERLSSVVDAILNADQYKEFGSHLEDYNGVLMYGPPGNGKTHLAQATANEFQFDFVKVIGSSLASGVRDGAVKILDEIVQNVVKLSALYPVMLFFDEFDSILHSMDSKLRGTLLDRISYIRKKGNILLMAATNSELHELDEATIRDGRFDEKIRFDNPQDLLNIKQFFISFCSGAMFENSSLDFDVLASSIALGKTSISSIEKKSKDAKRKAIHSKKRINDKAVLKMEYFN